MDVVGPRLLLGQQGARSGSPSPASRSRRAGRTGGQLARAVTARRPRSRRPRAPRRTCGRALGPPRASMSTFSPVTLDDVRPGDEHPAFRRHHHDVGQRRAVGRTTRRRAEHDRDLRHPARGADHRGEHLAHRVQCLDTLGQPGAAGVPQPDHRAPHPHRGLDRLDDVPAALAAHARHPSWWRRCSRPRPSHRRSGRARRIRRSGPVGGSGRGCRRRGGHPAAPQGHGGPAVGGRCRAGGWPAPSSAGRIGPSVKGWATDVTGTPDMPWA